MTCDRLKCNRPAAFKVRLDFAKGDRITTKSEDLCEEHTREIQRWAIDDPYVEAMFAEPIWPEEHAVGAA